MKVIYIAAPFRAKTPWLVEQNIRLAENIALQVAELGGIPLCPHTMFRFFDKSLPDQFWLDAALGVVRLEHWNDLQEFLK